jgi:hypothetical protein
LKKKKTLHKKELVGWLKVNALISNSSTTTEEEEEEEEAAAALSDLLQRGHIPWLCISCTHHRCPYQTSTHSQIFFH